jgi:hypothetical protein
LLEEVKAAQDTLNTGKNIEMKVFIWMITGIRENCAGRAVGWKLTFRESRVKWESTTPNSWNGDMNGKRVF